MAVTAFVMILNETTVSIALPDLAKVMAVSATTVQWLISGFLVMMAVVIPTTGFVLERFAPRTIYLVAVGSFMLGTLLSAIAVDFPFLLVGRIVQACGTAVMIPLLMTTVMRLVPAHRRGAMMGTISIVIGVAPAIGPTIGGAILASLGWRWMFWLVLVLAAMVFTFALAYLRVPSRLQPSRVDLISVGLSAVGFAGVVYGLSSIGQDTAVLPSWASVAIGVAALAVFVMRQRRLQASAARGRRARPLLDLRIVNYARYRLALILSVLMFMALLGAGAVLLPMYLQNVLGHGAGIAGLALLPGGLVMAGVSRPVGNLYDRVGARRLLIPGSIGMSVALAGFAALGAGAPLVAVIGCDVVLMASLGLMMTPLMADGLGALPDELYSHGSALLAALQQVAGALGSAAFVAIAAMGADTADGTPDAAGLRLGFSAAAAVGAGAIVVALCYTRARLAAPADITTSRGAR